MERNLLRRFSNDRRGNAIFIYVMCMPVLALVIGFSIDFGRAAQLRTRLNAAADAAALAALTPAMMAQSNAIAQAAAASMFNGQSQALAGLAPRGATVTVTIANPNGNVLIRTVDVCYSAAEQTVFDGLLGSSTLTLGDCSSARAEIPPNIDFYLMLDNSPSMSLPATSAGITEMENLTLRQESGGCAFACHQGSTNNGDTAGNTCANGSKPTLSGGLYCASSQGAQIDNYQLARNNSITLRLDELTSAVSTLMSTAQTTSSSTPYNPPPAYRFAINSMDSSWRIGVDNLMSLTSDYSSGWATAAATFRVMEMYANNEVCSTSTCTGNGGVGDVETNYDNALGGSNTQMPDPGNGTNQSGDSPQEVLFFVTDGVEDEENGGVRLIQPINGGVATNYCTEIKSRGIKIAILYTEYLPVPVNSFYDNRVEPFQPDIGPALQACASPGLFYDAATGADLGQALSSLFQAVVQSANLTL